MLLQGNRFYWKRLHFCQHIRAMHIKYPSENKKRFDESYWWINQQYST